TAALHDHRIGALGASRLHALGLLTPGRTRVATAIRAAAVRVIDRVHRDAADRRPDAAPAIRTGLADRAQAVLFVADLADRGAALDVHPPDFARTQANL